MMYRYQGSRRTYCRCQCECGKEKIIVAEGLRRNKNISCGCKSAYYRSLNNRTNEIGNKYGRLTIIDIDYSKKPSVAKCVCDCGNEVYICKTDVVSGHTKSCGCLQSENTSKANTKDFSGVYSDTGVLLISQAYQNKRGVWIWNCVCPICGNTFQALPAKILSNHTTSCGCRIRSSNERMIEKHLKSINANYKREFRFSDCKYKYTLPFDFAVFDSDNSLICLIEYDGEQHFRPVNFYGGISSYEDTQIRDNIKTEYCQNNNIKLLRFNHKDTNTYIKQTITNTIYP